MISIHRSAARTRCAAVLLLVAGSFTLPASGVAQTCTGTRIPAGNVIGQTWTSAGSPYCVQGNIIVAGLTINPGVTVQVWPNVQISVAGSITALGTVAQPIVFTAATSRWAGMDFNNATGASTLQHCRIELANNSGLRIIQSTPAILDCEIVNNTAPGGGGGVDVSLGTGKLTLTRCLIDRNTAQGNGGGLRADLLAAGALEMDRCVVSHNVAGVSSGTWHGGGINAYGRPGGTASCKLVDCDIVANKLSVDYFAHGGGVAFGEVQATMDRCLVRSNLAQQYYNGYCWQAAASRGAGIYATGSSASVTLTMRATAVFCNQAIATPQCAYPSNVVYFSGITANLDNCTLVRNRASGQISYTYGGVYAAGNAVVSLRNSIAFLNTDGTTNPTPIQIFTESGSTANVDYSCVQGWAGPGTGNLTTTNPILAGPACACTDVEIVSISPCVDTGDPSASYQDACIPPSFGTPRNDMGFTGGPLGCGWTAWTHPTQPLPTPTLHLDVDPLRSCPTNPSNLTFTARGGARAQVAGIFLIGVGSTPVAPPAWLPWLPPQFSTTGIFDFTVTAPPLCWTSSLTLRAYGLDAAGGLVQSNDLTW